ncbi:hypothetical protein BDZ89DRAFT_1061223 [Hymenopellis radicata]|nr:hypothetical protein BDZ89DRAFT_1061223 [Hymenopellis radicata]
MSSVVNKNVIIPGRKDDAYSVQTTYERLLSKVNELEAVESDTEDQGPTTRSTTRSHTRAYGAYTPTPSREDRRASTQHIDKERQQSRDRSRAVRRLLRNDSMNHGITKVKGITRRIHSNAKLIDTSFEPTLGRRKTMYTGPKDRNTDATDGFVPSLDFLLEDLKFQLLKWGGRRPISIIDSKRRILVHLAGRPDDFDDVVTELNRVFADAEAKLKVSSKRHRRGRFGAVTFGNSVGGGQKYPMKTKLSDHNEQVVEELMSNWAVTRLIGFVDKAFASVHPDLHARYSNVLDALLDHHPRLRRCFDHSVFAACTINVGRVVTYRHHDHLNLVTGMCCITAGGDFDCTRGGHLILWDLKLVIQFPPGSTIMIPSALLEHSNVGISEGETRWSFTQFSAAGLFRWVDNGFQTDGKIIGELKDDEKKAEEWEAFLERRSKVWDEGLKLIGTLKEV